jgi:uncharacterized DUF497 family protein
MITFTWDKRKAQNNLKKHNVSFEEATEIWNDGFAAFLHDPSHSDNEDTYIMIGYSSKKQFTLCIVY